MKVTDPALLAQLNGTKVTDPAVLAQLNGKDGPQLNALQRGAAERVLGGEELINNLGVGKHIGLPDNHIIDSALKDSEEQQTAAKASQGNTGAALSRAGHLLGDPLTWAGGGAAKGAAGSLDLAKAGAAYGAASGATNPAKDIVHNLEHAAVGAGVGAVAPAAVASAAKGVKAAAKGAKDLISPSAVSPEIASIVKSAEKAGIKVPTAGILPKGGVLAEHANVSGMKEYTDAVNKKSVDLIGAGDKHATINEAALNDGYKNVGNDFDKVAKEIGKVSIGKPVSQSEKLSFQMHGITPPETAYSKIEKIVNGALPSDKTAWKRIVGDAQSMVDADGKIDASNIKKLISYDSDLAKKARSTTSDAGEAKKIMGILKGELYNAATPEQRVKLADLDHKYKLLTAFDKAGTRTGAGQTLSPEKIRDVIDSAYKESGENQYPARELKTLLDTLHPPTGTVSPIKGLTNPKLSTGLPIGNPLHGSLLGRAMDYAPQKIASGVVNRPGFRKKLLGTDEVLGAQVSKVGP